LLTLLLDVFNFSLATGHEHGLGPATVTAAAVTEESSVAMTLATKKYCIHPECGTLLKLPDNCQQYLITAGFSQVLGLFVLLIHE
jgi:hypothetical protein